MRNRDKINKTNLADFLYQIQNFSDNHCEVFCIIDAIRGKEETIYCPLNDEVEIIAKDKSLCYSCICNWLNQKVDF